MYTPFQLLLPKFLVSALKDIVMFHEFEEPTYYALLLTTKIPDKYVETILPNLPYVTNTGLSYLLPSAACQVGSYHKLSD
jgi:hypothetical protein